MTVTEIVRHTLRTLAEDLQDELILVGVSGGVDSLVLLTTLEALMDEFGYDLHVASYDHGLRGEESRADADFVRQIAQARGLPVTLGAEDVAGLARAQKLNLEEAARQARYTFLLETAISEGAGIIAVGHHRDDQIETVLMHLIRGTGLSGLRGMEPFAPLSPAHLRNDVSDRLLDDLEMEDVYLLRPLLGVPRAQIEAHAAEMGILAREDPTNADTRYFRNQLRHEMIPLIKELNPHGPAAIARLAEIVRGDLEIIHEAVVSTVARIVDWGETPGGEVAFIDRHEFKRLSLGMQRQVLRHIVFDLVPDLRDLAHKQVDEAIEMIESGGTGQRLSLPGDTVLWIGYDDCTLSAGGEMPFPRHIPHMDPRRVVPLNITSEHEIDPGVRFYSYWVVEGRSLEVLRDDLLEATLSIPADAELTLRTRRPGDRFCPLGMHGRTQKLSDTMTNLKIPRPLRDRVPLLLVNDEIAWFVAPTAQGLRGRISQQYAVSAESHSVLRVRWELSP
ncbi:MAG: tRNA lysidine(34) synthetase TilS [Anaerolineales bacterium]